jgi:hypothetical protein
VQPSWVAIDPVVLRRLYVDEGLVAEEIARRCGCAATTVFRRLRAAGIKARPRGPTPGRSDARHARETRPLIWTPQIAWIVGLIATDGNLSRQHGLSITSKDRDLLETVQGCLGLGKGLGACRNGQGLLYSKLQWHDRPFYAWLTELGLTPAKSLTLKPLAVPDEYFRDFLRGCIDGDGSIVVYTDRYHTEKNARYVYERLYVSVVSASRPFADWLLLTARRLLGVRGSVRVSIKARPDRPNPVYAVRFAKRDSTRVLRWIYYSDDVPCLARKRAKAAPFLSGERAGILAAGGVSKLVNDAASKAAARKGLGVRVPSPLPSILDRPAAGPVP